MTKIIFKVVLLLLLTQLNLFAQDKIGLFVGINNFIKGGDNPNRYNVNLTGLNAGFLIPINISKIKILYKVKGVFHKADSSIERNLKLDKYIHLSNSILFGKDIKLNKLKLLPQAGIGVHNESIYDKWGTGFSSAEMFFDLVIILKHTLPKVSFGLMANYEYGFFKPNDAMVSNKRFLISLLLFH